MRIARVEWNGAARWAVLRAGDWHLLAGSAHLDATGGVELAPETGRVLPAEEARLLAPAVPSKILCLGRNYADHILEMGYQRVDRPAVFMKPPTTVIGPGQSVVLPPPELSGRVEHEAEVAVVIGRVARNLTAAQAAGCVLGVTCADDVSARDLQRADPLPTRGKGFDTFCPLGPWIETGVDITADLTVTCHVNGVLRQRGSTRQMILGVAEFVSYVSRFATLLPGDVLLTGSPGGTGPLVAGDVVDIEVEGVGRLRHGVSAGGELGPAAGAGAD